MTYGYRPGGWDRGTSPPHWGTSICALSFVVWPGGPATDIYDARTRWWCTPPGGRRGRVRAGGCRYRGPLRYKNMPLRRRLRPGTRVEVTWADAWTELDRELRPGQELPAVCHTSIGYVVSYTKESMLLSWHHQDIDGITELPPYSGFICIPSALIQKVEPWPS